MYNSSNYYEKQTNQRIILIKVMTTLIFIRKIGHTISTSFTAGTESRDISLRMVKTEEMMIEMEKNGELDCGRRS